MQIKICGLTDMVNIEEIATLCPDYMGFVFYNQSPRYAGETLNEIQLQNLDTRVKKVGVFVDVMPRDVAEISRQYFLNAVQLHGDEAVSSVKEMARLLGGIMIIKAFRIDSSFDFSTITPYEEWCSLFIFDTAGPGFGGTGEAFDWELLKGYRGSVPFLLAGGIGIENLDSALDFVNSHPAGKGVDLSSAIEVKPGLKSVSRTRTAIQKVKNYGLG